jgi:hypothetical protein
MCQLQSLELELVCAILKANQESYPSLLEHLPNLTVKSREYTGVGLYVNFEDKTTNLYSPKDAIISSGKRLIIEGVDYELSYELNITDGRLHFLEIVTNDGQWDGTFKNYELLN